MSVEINNSINPSLEGAVLALRNSPIFNDKGAKDTLRNLVAQNLIPPRSE